MEDSSSVHKESEDIKNRTLLFNMDYDSGYISHNPESNLDSSSDNAENLKHMTSKPFYLSEDALLEIPDLCKYSALNREIERENYEETRNIFNSPILSIATTHVSGSTESGRSLELNYSGFESEESDMSFEVPYCKQIIHNTSIENAKNNVYSSNDLQDIKREAFKNIYNKHSAFSNITNTLVSSDQTKKLTLIFSKTDKENIYSVKRKYHSLTPDRNFSDEKYVPSPRKLDLVSSIENGSFESNSELCLEPEPNEECVEYVHFNIDMSDEHTSLKENFINFNGSLINDDNGGCKENSIQNISYFNSIESAMIKHEDISTLKTGLPEETCKGFNKKEQHTFTTYLKPNINAYLIQNCKDEINSENSSIHSEHVELKSENVNEYLTFKEKKSEKVILESEPLKIKSENSPVQSDHIEIKSDNLDKPEKLISNENILKKFSLETEHIEIKSENMNNLETINESVEDRSKNLQNNSSENNNSILLAAAISVCDNIKTSNIVPTGNNDNVSNNLNLTHNVHSYFSTPEKSYTNYNNFGLSPDLFTEDAIQENVLEVIQPTVYTAQERNHVKKDHLILKRVQNNLKGVIPPHSVTVFRMSIVEMLSKIEDNKTYFWDTSTINKQPNDQDSKSLLISTSCEICKTKQFPEILKDRGLGLYHNRSKFSEEFEDLCVKYGQRYVGAETQSSCTVFETNTISPTKRRHNKPQWNTKSPGKRLSHLARRRITFSSANLQSGNSFLAGSRARQILVDAKKLDLLGRRKSPRKSPRKTPKKTPGKSPRIKTRTPSSSAKKKLAMRFRKVTGEIKTSSINTSIDSASLSAKRTLFNSPDNDKKLNRILPSTSGASSTDKRNSSKRALFMSPSKCSSLKNLGFKRKRTDDSIEDFPSKFARCHSEIIPKDSDVKTLGSRTRSELILSQNRQIKELTTNHKKKLQLAIYEALRSQNILPTHPQFKTFASNLGRLTRKLFLVTTADSVGVTEKMLRIARHHVISVVKGKSPEEIYEEFVKQRAKNLKPQGYVPVEAEKSNSEKNVTCSGKTTNSDNKIERIRKAFNFGDDDNR